jgi:hypothetical protein
MQINSKAITGLKNLQLPTYYEVFWENTLLLFFYKFAELSKPDIQHSGRNPKKSAFTIPARYRKTPVDIKFLVHY